MKAEKKEAEPMAVFLREDDAFEFAFSQHTDMVYRIALNNTRSTADAQDITQEVFMRLLESSKAFKDSNHLKAWLIRVTINLCHDEFKRNQRLSDSFNEIRDEAVFNESPVAEAVNSLPENYRNAIYLHYYEGYTAKEIGKILGAKENTVLSWLSRARQKLKEELAGGFDNE